MNDSDSSPGNGAARPQAAGWQELLDALPAAIYTTDAQGHLTYFNPACVEFSGRTPRLGTTEWCVTWKLYHPDGRPMPHDQCPMAVALKEGRVIHGAEAIAERPDGTRIWFAPFPTPLRNEQGRIIGGINMLVDITARKRADQERQANEAQLQAVIRGASVGIILVDPAGNLIDVNPRFAQMLGRPRDELLTRSCADLTHPEDWACNHRLMKDVADGTRDEFSIEKRYLRGDGAWLWVSVSVSPLRDSLGRIDRLLAIVQDIHARKTAEEALERKVRQQSLLSEALAALLSTDSPDAVVRDLFPRVAELLGVDTYFNFMVNAAGDALYLHSHGGISPGTARDLARLEFGQAICGTVAQTCNRIVATDIQRSDDEKAALVRSMGIRSYACHPLLSGGRLLGTLSFASKTRDAFNPDELEFMRLICDYVALAMERQQAGEARARLAAIVKSSDDAIISEDLDGLIQTWNHGAQRLFGYTAQEAIGQPVTLLYPPDRRDEESSILARIRAGVRIDHYDTVRRRKDGTLVDVSLTVSPLVDTNAQVIGASKIARDITERKRHEAALRRSEEKLQLVLETDAVAVSFLDHAGTLIGANDVFLRMTGYRREQIDRRELTWRAMTPPEWINVSTRQFEQLTRTGRISPYEKEYLLADGTRRWMLIAGRDLGDGTIAEFCIDIAETKRREADGRLLAALGSEMVSADRPQVIYEKLMDAAVRLMRSQFASMQLFHPERGAAGELQLLAQRGFDPEKAKFWEWVSANSTCVCGLALRAGARVVIPDAAQSGSLDDDQKRAYRDAGIRSMQSTPLFSRGGKLLGMISTHWDHPCQPTENELSNFDILARQAADIIERDQARRHMEADLHAMTLLHQVGSACAQPAADQSACLKTVLDAAIAVAGADKGNIQLLDAARGGLVIAAHRGFSSDFLKFFSLVEAGEASVCGRALQAGRQTLVHDITRSDVFVGTPALHVLQNDGVRAVQSTPLIAGTGRVIGMISTHHAKPCTPEPRTLRILELLARTAADTIERKQAEEALRLHAQELNAFNQAAVGRELRMIELKKEVNGLRRRLGLPDRYCMDGIEEPELLSDRRVAHSVAS